MRILYLSLLFLIPVLCSAQDSLSLYDKAFDLPDKFFGAINKKSEKFEQNLLRSTEKMYGFVGVTFTGFQKLAGALHVRGNLTKDDMKDIILNGKTYGDPPTYGENYYQYRMSYKGWHDAKSD